MVATKTPRINIGLTPEIRDALRQRAKDEGRSESQMAARLLEHALRRTKKCRAFNG
jgi:hypothetical protein